MIGNLVVGGAIILMVLGSLYLVRRDRKRGVVCSGCGGNCSCGTRHANPINVSIDESADKH